MTDDDARWIYWDDGERPLVLADLPALVRSGRIDPATDMRRMTEPGWKPARLHFPELFPDHAEPPAQAAGWTDTKPHPWRRYAARMIDTFVVGAITWALVEVLAYALAPSAAEAFLGLFAVPGGQFLEIILTFLFVIPFNALAIGSTGLTLGKWIFGVRVLKDGRPMGALAALKREFSVFFRGLGLAIPFASLFTLIGSYNQLKDDRITHWDKAGKLTVTHRPESLAATVGMWAAFVLFLLARTVLLAASRQ